MGVQVDEPRRDVHPCGIDDLDSLSGVEAAHRLDTARGDANVTPDPWRASPVEHEAVLDDDVEPALNPHGGHPRRNGSRPQSCGRLEAAVRRYSMPAGNNAARRVLYRQ